MTSLGHPEVVETPAAVLFLLGERAYKLRKPVELGRHDFRRRTDRFHLCHREVQLNRRLAPDVHLGVTDLLGVDGEPCEHLVVMRRMPADRRLSTLVRSRTPLDDEMRRLARVLTVFHAGARRGTAIDAEATLTELQDRWDTLAGRLGRFHCGMLSATDAIEAHQRAHQFLAGRESLLAERVAQGRIVDGHGDLNTDDIFLLDDGPRVLGCLAFDDRLRCLDVLDDVASLTVDLEQLGAPALADHFLTAYLAFSGDPGPAALRHHYSAYRALSRAELGCLRHEQGDPSAAGDVAAHLGLALRHLRAGTVRLVLLGGPSATGRSGLAGRLADRLGATVLSGNRIRRELAGIDPDGSSASDFRTGIYTAEWTERTYAELIWRARRLLEHGETVILDASWSRDRHRGRARELAGCTHSELVELRCAPDPDRPAGRWTGCAPDDLGIRLAAAAARDADDWPQARTVDAEAPALTVLGGTFGPDETGHQPPVTMRPAANSRP
ncbi:AAA family ATPase [Actinoplanes oblitus]|uniref:AAA family ATPase n=1 Tax=Actinoplanes oblitus TaxID=3040509 RepID=A0ABY8WU46_9ACTN|nr:AAA family ATPase [Actinoplanes oblitus]WIN00562.1 AAA family ATPase [Actinoplanes oblitus]